MKTAPDISTTDISAPDSSIASLQGIVVDLPRLNPRFVVRCVLALCILGSGLLNSCAQLPENSRLHFDRGMEAKGKDDEQAIELFTQAIKTAGEKSFFYTKALLERGDCHMRIWQTASGSNKIDHLAQALADFEAVSTWDRPAVLDKARALEGEGRVYIRRHNPQLAEASFEELLTVHPDAYLTDATLLHHHLNARRELGWIRLNDLLTPHAMNMDVDSPELSASLREAQQQFFAGLLIDSQDPLCNLGRGICLHLRGQSRSAIPHLELAISSAARSGSAISEDDPQPFFYLARSMEEASGYQKQAVDYIVSALDRDKDRDFLPLYSHLAAEFKVYITVTDQPLEFFLEMLLDYRGRELAYWEQVSVLIDGLMQEQLEVNSERDELFNVALALSATRQDKIDEAVYYLIGLKESENFETFLDQIFVDDSEADPAMVYGRAVILFELGQQDRLESWLQVERRRLEDLIANEWARKALHICGRNLLELSRVEISAEAPVEAPIEEPSTEEITRRADRLRIAREIFLRCLSSDASDADAQLGLASSLEGLGLYDEALEAYEPLVEKDVPPRSLYRDLKQFHCNPSLSEAQKSRAWAWLHDYSGEDAELLAYVRDIQLELERRTLHVCRGCGRQSLGTRQYCLECGRRLTPLGTPER